MTTTDTAAARASTRAASSASDVLALPLGFAVALAFAAAGALHEVAGVEPALYSSQGFGPARAWPVVIGLFSCAFGAFALGRARRPEALLGFSLALAALAAGLSAPLLFYAFGHSGPVSALL